MAKRMGAQSRAATAGGAPHRHERSLLALGAHREPDEERGQAHGHTASERNGDVATAKRNGSLSRVEDRTRHGDQPDQQCGSAPAAATALAARPAEDQAVGGVPDEQDHTTGPGRRGRSRSDRSRDRPGAESRAPARATTQATNASEAHSSGGTAPSARRRAFTPGPAPGQARAAWRRRTRRQIPSTSSAGGASLMSRLASR